MVYLPPKASKAEFDKLTKYTASLTSQGTTIIIMGDLNVRTGQQDRKTAIPINNNHL